MSFKAKLSFMTQIHQKEWLEQWQRFEDQEQWLFEDWIWPAKLEDMRGKRVLDAGCGTGNAGSV
jgi:SAM-dependent methyltransferase